jgi:hypothetical protein
MTDSQFLVIIATIWIAPHVKGGTFVGLLMLCFASLKGLGIL